ncbi:MAG: FG-GAP-like repeat-containing protein [Phycisphaerales bacterium]
MQLKDVLAVRYVVSALLFSFCPSTNLFAQPKIPSFTDETDGRLVADPDVGDSDTSEKDYGLGDFDNDGDMDIIVARRIALNGNNGSPLPNTLFMNGSGVLTDMTAARAPALLDANRSRDVVVADFNNDGWLDAMIVNGPAAAPVLLINLQDIGDGWLGFSSAPNMLPKGFSVDAWSVAAGDLTNDDDAYPDVFVGVRSGNDRILVNLGAQEGTWRGFEDGSARLGANANTSAVRSSEILDINGDGDEDILEGVTSPTGALRMLANDGAGMFASTPQTIASGAVYNFATGDLDGNGVMDFFGVRNGFDQYRENLGPGKDDAVNLGALFTAPNSNGFGAICRVADLNTDGTDDFLVTDLDQEFPQDCARHLKIFVNSGKSPYLTEAYPVQQPWTPNGTSDVALLDLDDDGDLDMFIGHCTGNSVFTQDGSPNVLGDIDGDGSVGAADLLILLANWGSCADCDACPADLNADCTVGAADLLILLANWG